MKFKELQAFMLIFSMLFCSFIATTIVMAANDNNNATFQDGDYEYCYQSEWNGTTWNSDKTEGWGIRYIGTGKSAGSPLNNGNEKLNGHSITSMARMFYNNSTLTNIDLSGFDTSQVTSMCEAFMNASKLETINLTGLNTSNVTNMIGVFRDCKVLTSLDLSSFNTRNVTAFRNMFYNCYKLATLNLSSFNTHNATSFEGMFYNCYKLASLDLSNFSTENCTSFNLMFFYCSSLKSLDLSKFNTDKTIYFSAMFYNCMQLTDLDISGFNIVKSEKVYTGSMFFNCKKLKTLKTPAACPPFVTLPVIMKDSNNYKYINLVPNKTLTTITQDHKYKYSYSSSNNRYYGIDKSNYSSRLTYCLNYITAPLYYDGQCSSPIPLSEIKDTGNVALNINNAVAVGYPYDYYNLSSYIVNDLGITDPIEAANTFIKATQYAVQKYSCGTPVTPSDNNAKLVFNKMIEKIDAATTCLNDSLCVGIIMPDNDYVDSLLVVKAPAGSAAVSKVDKNGNRLDNAGFNISYTETNQIAKGRINDVATNRLSWMSSSRMATVVTPPYGKSILKEVQAPAGYARNLNDITIPDNKSERLYVVSNESSTDARVVFSRIDNHNIHVTDSIIQVINETGDVVKEWTTQGDDESFTFPKGTYTVHEKETSVLAQPFVDTTFTISEDGKITGNAVVGNDIILLKTERLSVASISNSISCMGESDLIEEEQPFIFCAENGCFEKYVIIKNDDKSTMQTVDLAGSSLLQCTLKTNDTIYLIGTYDAVHVAKEQAPETFVMANIRYDYSNSVLEEESASDFLSSIDINDAEDIVLTNSLKLWKYVPEIYEEEEQIIQQDLIIKTSYNYFISKIDDSTNQELPNAKLVLISGGNGGMVQAPRKRVNTKALEGDNEDIFTEEEHLFLDNLIYKLRENETEDKWWYIEDTWLSSTEKHLVDFPSMVKYDRSSRTFILLEISAPNGYSKIDKMIVFHVDPEGENAGKFILDSSFTFSESEETVQTETSRVEITPNTIILKNTPITFPVSFKKISDYDKSVSGAKLQILQNNTIVSEWTTDRTTKIVNLKAGNYILHEESAPFGYLKAADISFEVKSDGSVFVNQKESANNTIVMIDKLSIVDAGIVFAVIPFAFAVLLGGSILTIRHKKRRKTAP